MLIRSERIAIVITPLTFASLLCCGCATVVSGQSQNLVVKTDPAGASCELKREGQSLAFVDPTPGNAQLSKSVKDIDVTCKKKGYVEAGATLRSSVQGWTFGNIIAGGVIGVAVDAASGAMHKYQTELLLTLEPEEFASEEQRDAFFKIWTAELTRETARRKAEISSSCDPAQCPALLKQADVDGELASLEIEAARLRAKVAQPPSVAAGGGSEEGLPQSPVRPGDKWKYALTSRGQTLRTIWVEIAEASGSRAKERITVEGFKTFLEEREVTVPFAPARFQPTVTLPGGYQLAELSPYFPPGTKLKAQQRWEAVPGEFKVPMRPRSMLTADVRVAGQEKVHVPAGTFDTWKIEAEMDGPAFQGSPLRIVCTYWYSPKMLRTVKMHIDYRSEIQVVASSDTFELTAFERAR